VCEDALCNMNRRNGDGINTLLNARAYLLHAAKRLAAEGGTLQNPSSEAE
jgi:hypothetical protein